MAKKINKDEMFNDFLHSVVDVFTLIEDEFGVSLLTQTIGVSENEFLTPEGTKIARKSLKELQAWKSLSELYDYAIDGILHEYGGTGGEDRATEIVIGSAEILSLVTSENHGPSQKWDNIVALGDGRFALDSGANVELNKLSLLAGVDQRTVRNAISAKEIDAVKISGTIYVTNNSAVKWLSSRRGYTPTRFICDSKKSLSTISSATELGSFLSDIREKLNHNKNETIPSVLSSDALSQIESGVFNLSLDCVFHMADFYQVERGDLLEAIMRIFFPEQLKALTYSTN